MVNHHGEYNDTGDIRLYHQRHHEQGQANQETEGVKAMKCCQCHKKEGRIKWNSWWFCSMLCLNIWRKEHQRERWSR